ncbi:Unknown protein, partial [Striga hermonthica]
HPTRRLRVVPLAVVQARPCVSDRGTDQLVHRLSRVSRVRAGPSRHAELGPRSNRTAHSQANDRPTPSEPSVQFSRIGPVSRT